MENNQEEGEFHTQQRAVTSLRLWRHGGIVHLTRLLQWMDIDLLPITGLSPLKRIGEAPNGWKKANVPPILKKGKKGNLGNYSPSSLTLGLRK